MYDFTVYSFLCPPSRPLLSTHSPLASLLLSFATIVVNFATDEDAARRVVSGIEAAGGRAIAVRGDVSRREDFERIFDDATSAFGGVDVLVNNAGLMSNMTIGSVDGSLSAERSCSSLPC